MKAAFFLLLLLLPFLAFADLYRWVDPESGSVKLSSAPPPWYESGSGPKVERIPYSGPAAKPAAEAAPPASAWPKPSAPKPPGPPPAPPEKK